MPLPAVAVAAWATRQPRQLSCHRGLGRALPQPAVRRHLEYVKSLSLQLSTEKTTQAPGVCVHS